MVDNEMQLEEFARQLGITDIPVAWERHWPAFNAWLSGGKCSSLSWERPQKAAEVFDLPAECLNPLEAIFATIRANAPLGRLADLWHYLLYHLPGDIGGIPDTWPLPEAWVNGEFRLFRLAMMVSGADHAEANFAVTGVSRDVTRATLGYIGRFARDIKERRDVWGLEALGWLRNYIRARIFRLGRLTFMAGKYSRPFRAYKNRHTGEVLTLCEGGSYRKDGLANNTNGILDPDPWTPVFEMGEGAVTACPVSKEGIALKKPITLKTSDWEQVLAPGDDSVEVHIAGGSPLLPDDCTDAYGQAIEFFPRYYPQSHFAVFTCGSWLLDPALSKILPPESNIVRFQKAFHWLPIAAGEEQTYDLVFGSPTADPTTAPRTTQLRRVIAEYVETGNRMRASVGYITWDEAIALASAEHSRKPTALP